jgi:hypothetical protein
MMGVPGAKITPLLPGDCRWSSFVRICAFEDSLFLQDAKMAFDYEMKLDPTRKFASDEKFLDPSDQSSPARKRYRQR